MVALNVELPKNISTALAMIQMATKSSSVKSVIISGLLKNLNKDPKTDQLIAVPTAVTHLINM